MHNIALTYHRRATCTVRVGGLCIGSDYPIRIQTMANTDTNAIEQSVEQARRCFAAGAELVRFTTQGSKEVESLKKIKEHFTEPLVADIHFNANIADEAAKITDKVRINPGNYIDPARQFKHIEYTDEQYLQELERLRSRFVKLLNICKEYHTALRIGVNHGSLSDRIMSRFGDTPAGMVESCMEFLRVCVREKFSDVVISIKASNTSVMIQTVRMLVATMDKEDMHFPLHLGVTEAGEGEDGRIKSAVGIGALLSDGIGDTIRVSLSEAPEKEIPVAKELADYFAVKTSPRYNDVKAYRDATRAYYISKEKTDWHTFCLHAAADFRAIANENTTDYIIQNDYFPQADLQKLSKDILQAAGLIRYKTEYISCPSCGRTLFDIEQTIQQVKQATAHLKGLKIGIMGCIVNGPGEMADADYGYVGAARGKVSLYRGKECVMKNIPQEQAVEKLLELIEKDRNK